MGFRNFWPFLCLNNSGTKCILETSAFDIMTVVNTNKSFGRELSKLF
jgi:hypothetical protein